MNQRCDRLRRLRDRFVALNSRSRSLRLTRISSSHTFDLEQLQTHVPDAWSALVAKLGRGAAEVELLRKQPQHLDREVLARQIATLAHRAHAAWLETGIEDLAVGWPFVEGATADGTWLRGPLLVYPARLQRSESGVWLLQLTGLPDLNETLAQVLERTCGVRLTLDELLEEDDDRLFAVDGSTWRGMGRCLQKLGLPLAGKNTDLPPVAPLEPRAKEARDAADPNRFALCNHMILGRFPSSASALIGDYDQLVGGAADERSLGRATDLLEVDDARLPAPDASGCDRPGAVAGTTSATGEPSGLRRFVVLPSDGSQDQVMRWLDDPAGRGLVVQGPPGTGKSQLIANLIAAGLGQGLKVLLVCQKRVALDVVADRLDAAGLREPLALVHNTQRDRGAVMGAVAASLAPLLEVNPGGSREDLEQVAAARTLAGRLAVVDVAYHRLVDPLDGHPPLVELDEMVAHGDDGRALPDLRSVAAGATVAEADRWAPHLDRWGVQTCELAAPHPLAARADWAGLEVDAIERSFGELRRLQALVAQLDVPDATMTAAQASALGDLWHRLEPLLDLLRVGDEQALRRFQLFWGWCNGATDDGEWSRLVRRLEQARATLRPAPRPLIAESRQTLEEWQRWLGELRQLQRLWYRPFLPRWWRLRDLPAEILGRCSASDLPVKRDTDLVARALRLVERARAWQALIDEMPIDHPFVDFGFQGALEGIDEALAGLRQHSSCVRAVHAAFHALQRSGTPYDVLPAVADTGDLLALSFARALLADADLSTAKNELGHALQKSRKSLDSGFFEVCTRVVETAESGEVTAALVTIDALIGAEADAGQARVLDEMVAEAPPWAKLFLRGWRPAGTSAGQDARLALGRAWRRLLRDPESDPLLEQPLIDPASRAALGEEFDRCRALAHRGVYNAWRNRIVDMADGDAGIAALGKLHHESRKQRRRLTMRQFVTRFWDQGLGAVRPVWLCSPETVAALFPLEVGLFDLVIFDEGSQCPVEAGLPVMVRGRRVVVAGDDQQMPPSHFFRAQALDDEDEDEEQLVLASPSMLGLGRLAYRHTTLRWHYRSHHESLIAFSNEVFYGGRLLTAPHARVDGEFDGLHWLPVDGLWGDSTNRKEAEAVVELVATILLQRDLDQHPLTIGVVTFNLPQADLIEELIDERCDRDPHFAALLRADRSRAPIEQLFVRNLENVQGDERDIIIFSVGYGPAEVGGPVSARFGPLGLAGGEKRLNVAVTRARRGIWVLCSFDPTQLDVAGTRNLGPRLFKSYLEYVKCVSSERATGGNAEQVRELLAQASTMNTGTGAVAGRRLQRRRFGLRTRDQMAAALRAQGLEVETGYGLSDGCMDIVARAPGETAYRVAIDCGAFLDEPETLVRDVYAPRFWERCGWRLVRVTPAMWYQDRAAVIAGAVAAIRNGRM